MSIRAAAAMPEFVPKEFWDREFSEKRAIPSSTRIEPSKSLLLFSEILGLASPLRVLDVGAGNGRNTVYLAKRGCDVTALDFSEFALREVRRRVEEAGLIEKVSIVEHFLDDPVPFPEGAFDFVLDAYLFCHFLKKDFARSFLRDMARITKPEGHFLSIAFSTEDEYYARLHKYSSDGSLVCDPANGIWKRLYSESEIKTLFSSYFDLKCFAKFEFPDMVLEKPYRRVVFTSVLKKRC